MTSVAAGYVGCALASRGSAYGLNKHPAEALVRRWSQAVQKRWDHAGLSDIQQIAAHKQLPEFAATEISVGIGFGPEHVFVELTERQDDSTPLEELAEFVDHVDQDFYAGLAVTRCWVRVRHTSPVPVTRNQASRPRIELPPRDPHTTQPLGVFGKLAR
ncbi:hypothetical protein OG225_41490 (plasmid) [Nocardia sp. NBC_01377]|uniref:hypothetical protein n=1 Tax=Nocardia sp. NBC_01377 TaxID=2903595 RepID=UPI002F90C8F7